MRAIVAALLMTSCTTPSPWGAEFTEYDRTRFLVAAVFEGLHEDYPDPALFEPLTKQRDLHFVEKCPVCNAVFDGISAYLRVTDVDYQPYTGRGFPEEWSAGLKSGDRAVRLKAIEAMVERYVARRFARLSMTPGEKDRMRAQIEEGKRVGQMVKDKSFGGICPSCAGATKK